MDSEQVIRIALTVITPILTAVIGIAAIVIGDWRERRTQTGQRKLAFEDAGRQVVFATEWWTASKLVADSADAEERATTQARAWLEEAAALVTGSKPSPVEERSTITLRRLLLAFPMRRRAARTLRGFFYFFLGVAVLEVSSALSAAFGRQDTLGIPDYFSRGFVYGDLIAICVSMVIAMAFRFSSQHIENSEPLAEAQGRMTLRRALLLYEFTRPAARIARVVFWFCVVLMLFNPVAIALDVFKDPRLLPGDLVALVAFTGWTVGVRYWAVSLEGRERATDDRTLGRIAGGRRHRRVSELNSALDDHGRAIAQNDDVAGAQTAPTSARLDL